MDKRLMAYSETFQAASALPAANKIPASTVMKIHGNL